MARLQARHRVARRAHWLQVKQVELRRAPDERYPGHAVVDRRVHRACGDVGIRAFPTRTGWRPGVVGSCWVRYP